MREPLVPIMLLVCVLLHLGLGSPKMAFIARFESLESIEEDYEDYEDNMMATNLHGRPISNLGASQAIGTRGEVLLQDVFLVDKLASFTRERIPERVVHAKGAGALGLYEVNQEISQYTKAKLFSTMDKRVPVAVRFSTVGGSLGSADTAIDPHGFAVKFYTEEGNFDLVGNSLESFPIRDPMLFPDLNRSRKKNPISNRKDPNTFWDFVANRTETTLHTLHLFSDLGRPDGYRAMDGSSVHAYKLVNADGDVCFAKFHWKSNQKKPALTHEEAADLVGIDPDYKTRDLYEAIDRGEFPSWSLSVQIMTLEQAENSPVNPFDITKVWKKSDFPLMPIGTLTLTFNPDNYFASTEQSAFAPSNLIPGIEPSPDRMLAGRLFAYQDAQRYRLGVNYPRLDINRPTVDTYAYVRDGKGNYGKNGGQNPNYWPNSRNGPIPDPEARESTFDVDGIVDRFDEQEDDVSLAQEFVNDEIDAEHRARLVAAIADHLKDADEGIRERVLEQIFYPISTEFRNEVRQAIVDALSEEGMERRRRCFV